MRTAQQFPALLGYLTIAPFVGKPQLTNSLNVSPEPRTVSFLCLGLVSVEHPTVAPPVQSVSPIKPSRPLTSLRCRILRRRPRFATPGTPVVARPSFYAVVFATRVTFLDVPLCLVVWWRIGRPLIH